MNEATANSSGNVPIDLGYSPDEAAILQMRADLMADRHKEPNCGHHLLLNHLFM